MSKLDSTLKARIITIALLCTIMAVIWGIYQFYVENNLATAFNFQLASDTELPQLEYKFAIGGADTSPPYQLNEPMAVDINEQGEIFVANTLDNSVKVFNQKGQSLRDIRDPQHLSLPADIKVYKKQIYIADAKNSRIQVFSDEGKFVQTLVGPEIGQEIGAWIPSALFVGPNGDIYVTDIFYQRVIVFSQTGKVLRYFGKAGQGPGQLLYPNGIVVNPEGDIYVADSNNGRIQVFSNQGKFKHILSLKDHAYKLGLPRGMTWLRNNLFVVDTFAHQLRTLQVAEGKISQTRSTGTRGNQGDQMNFPNDVALYKGMLVVADRANQRVLVYKVD